MKQTSNPCETCASRHKSLFHSCTLTEVRNLDEAKNCTSYKAGQTIFSESQKPYGVYCVLEGKIKLTKTGSEGKDHIVRLAKGGDVLGFRAALTSERFSASAVAIDDSKVCFIPLEVFKEIIEENPKVAHNLLVSLSQTLSETEEHLVTLALKPVRERLADALLLLRKVYGEGQSEPFTMNLSRENLASLVGTAKETVIRFLSEFKDEGMVDTKGSQIRVLEPKRLQAISELYD